MPKVIFFLSQGKTLVTHDSTHTICLRRNGLGAPGAPFSQDPIDISAGKRWPPIRCCWICMAFLVECATAQPQRSCQRKNHVVSLLCGAVGSEVYLGICPYQVQQKITFEASLRRYIRRSLTFEGTFEERRQRYLRRGCNLRRTFKGPFEGPFEASFKGSYEGLCSSQVS